MSNAPERPTSPTNRFRGGVPHYHRSSRHNDPDWDEWTGEPIKKSRGSSREYFIHGVGAVIAGCLLLMAVLTVIFFFWDKVLRYIGK